MAAGRGGGVRGVRAVAGGGVRGEPGPAGGGTGGGFWTKIITQNRIFCKAFDKTTASVTKNLSMSCFFCASYPQQLRAVGKRHFDARRNR